MDIAVKQMSANEAVTQVCSHFMHETPLFFLLLLFNQNSFFSCDIAPELSLLYVLVLTQMQIHYYMSSCA